MNRNCLCTNNFRLKSTSTGLDWLIHTVSLRAVLCECISAAFAVRTFEKLESIIRRAREHFHFGRRGVCCAVLWNAERY